MLAVTKHLFTPAGADSIFNKFTNQLTHHLGRGDIFLTTERFKTGLFFGIDQNAQSRCPLFAWQTLNLQFGFSLGQAYDLDDHSMGPQL